MTSRITQLFQFQQFDGLRKCTDCISKTATRLLAVILVQRFILLQKRRRGVQFILSRLEKVTLRHRLGCSCLSWRRWRTQCVTTLENCLGTWVTLAYCDWSTDPEWPVTLDGFDTPTKYNPRTHFDPPTPNSPKCCVGLLGVGGDLMAVPINVLQPHHASS
jgi:hypothetical protein